MSASYKKRSRATDNATQIEKSSKNSPRTSPQHNSKRMAYDESALLSKLDARMKEQSDFIITLLAKQMKQDNQDLTNTIQKQFEVVNKNINVINTKVQQLESDNLIIMNEIDSLKSDVTKINLELNETKKKLELSNAQLSSTKKELAEASTSIANLDNKFVASDAVMFGVPQLPEENLKSLYNHLCHTLDIKPPVVLDLFRSRPIQNSHKNTSIIIKFKSPYEKNFLLTSIAKHIKTNKTQLCLNDIGIASTAHIFVRESLSKMNNNLVRHAIELKKSNNIAAVFTIRGRVYVKRSLSDVRGICVDSVEDLERIAS